MKNIINIEDYGYIPGHTAYDETMIPARVTAVHKERYELICRYGRLYGRLKSGVYYADNRVRENFPTAGDFVLIRHNAAGDSMICLTLARRSCFSRREPGPVPRDQAVAANFDYVFIMTSLNHDFNPRRLERYLALAWPSGGIPVVLLTKADLADDCGNSGIIAAAAAVSGGADVRAVSAVNGYGIEELRRDYIKPRKTVVFLGSSGVGKSSLLNALAGGEIMAVSAIREDDSRGRHTTTHRQLIMLPNGAMIIDTPGMRELGMSRGGGFEIGTGGNEIDGVGESENGGGGNGEGDVNNDQQNNAFSDVEKWFGGCKFTNCKHKSEPGCAVKAALECGDLKRERWESYRKLKEEVGYWDDKTAYLRKKQDFHKKLAKYSRERKKHDD